MRFAIGEINRNESLLFGAKLDYQIVDTCNNIKRIQRDLKNRLLPKDENLGFVGPASSDSALLSAPILTSFGVPVISYSATSIDLSDRVLFNNFYRTVPSDSQQAIAIADLLQYFNWTYVSTVYSRGNYGQRGMEALMAEMAKRKICVQTRNLLPKYPQEKDIDEIVMKLHANPTATVVVIFTNTEDTNKLLRGIARSGERGEKITIVSSTAWSPDSGIATGLEKAAKGSLILSYDGMRVIEFEEYFKNLTLAENNYTWFREFWRETFRCETELRSSGRERYRNCTGKESLHNANINLEHSSVGAVLTAIHIYACAMRKNVLLKFCTGLAGVDLIRCVRRKNYPKFYHPRYDLFQIFRGKKTGCKEFKYSTDFKNDGSIERSFEILNFDGEYYRNVGKWRKIGVNTTNLAIDGAKITWKTAQKNMTPISSCRLPCYAGEISMKDVKRPDCCLRCEGCPELHVVRNSTCSPCAWNENPNRERTKCLKIPMMPFGMTQDMKSAIVAVFVIVIVCDVIVFGIFVHVSKILGFELQENIFKFVTFTSCLLCTLTTVPLLAKPTQLTCAQQHLLFSLAMATSYTVLACEAHWLYEVASAGQQHLTQMKRRKSSVIGCLGLIGLQLLLSTIWMTSSPPTINFQFTPLRARINVMCESDATMFVIVLIPSLLASIIAAYFGNVARQCHAVRTDSRNICIIASISLCLWAVFTPLLFWSRATGFIIEVALKALFADVIGALMLAWLCSLILKDYNKTRQVRPSSVNEGDN